MTAPVQLRQQPVPPQLTPKARNPAHRQHSAAMGSWLVSMSLTLVSIASVMLLRPIFVEPGWMPEVIIMAAAVCGSAAIVRTFTGRQSLAGLTGVAVALIVLAFVLRSDSPGGLPAAFSDTVSGIVQQVMSDVPPLRSTRALTVLLVIITAVVTLFGELCVFVFRGRVMALLPFAVFLILPVILGVEEIEIWAYLGLICAVGIFLFAVTQWHVRIADEELADRGSLVDERGAGGWRGSLTVVAITGVAALVAMTVLPAPVGLTGLNNLGVASLSTNRANPIIDLGSDLRRHSAVPVLRYVTTLRGGALPYLTLVSLTELSGDREWEPAEFAGELDATGQLPAPVGLAPETPATQIVSNVVLEPGVSSYLPQPGTAQQIRDLEGSYLRDEPMGNIRSAEGDAAGQRYQITTVMPEPDPARVAAAPLEVPEELREFTEVPDGQATDRIRELLNGIVEPGASPYAQALQVQNYFRSGFTYSLATPVQDGYDGSNLSGIATFLERRSGYCVHFASSMAVLGRMLGIPTRIQIGFTPGSPQEMNEGQQVYGVSSDDLHAWAELYVPGMGWVPFETTPPGGLGNLHAQGGGEASPAPAPQQPQPTQAQTQEATASPDGDTSPGPGASTPSASPEQTLEQPQQSGDGQQDALPAVLGVIAVIAVLLLLLALPMLIRLFVRRRRRALMVAAGQRGDGPVPAVIAWRELLDEARDLRRPVPELAPLRAQEAFLRGLLGEGEEAGEAIGRLRAALERALFTDPSRPAGGSGPEWPDVDAAERAMRAGASRRGRLLALVLPASLIVRRRTRP